MWTTVVADLTISKRPTANYGPTAGHASATPNMALRCYAATRTEENKRGMAVIGRAVHCCNQVSSL